MPAAPESLSLLRDIVLDLFPELAHADVYTYRVAAVRSDGSLDLDPTRAEARPLKGVPPFSLGGAQVTPDKGCEVLVVYADHDEAKPRILAFAPLSASRPAAVVIDATALRIGPLASARPAARETDFVHRLAQNSLTGIVYESTSKSAPYSWAPIAQIAGVPGPSDAGTRIDINDGSAVVVIG